MFITIGLMKPPTREHNARLVVQVRFPSFRYKVSARHSLANRKDVSHQFFLLRASVASLDNC